MPEYKVRDPKTGRGLTVHGPSPPTEAELEQLFASAEATGEPTPGIMERLKTSFGDLPTGNAIDVSLGMAKGAGHTAVSLADIVARLAGAGPNVRGPIETATAALEPSNLTQSVARGVEQVAELAYPATKIAQGARWLGSKLPAGLNFLARTGVEAAGGAGMAAAQGNDPSTGAKFGAAGPAAGAVGGVVVRIAAKMMGKQAVPLVLTAIKPTVTAMKRQLGASWVGIHGKANQLVRFIVDNNITTPDQAEAIIKGAEQEIGVVLQGQNILTKAPERAIRYIEALEHSASRQAIPTDDVALIRHEAAKLMAGPLAKSVPLLDAAGQPVYDNTGAVVMQRVLRDDVMADEALEIGRATSKWSTKKQWGEQKGAAIETSKAAERAVRDEAKLRVPDLRPLLARQGNAISAKEVLDRMLFRQSNRDVAGLPEIIAAAPALAQHKVPLLGILWHWVRTGGAMKLGMYANRFEKAMLSQDVPKALEVLSLVAGAAVAPPMKPVASHEPTQPASVPPPTPDVLQGVGPGRHTLTDNSVWDKTADGSIRRVQ